MLLAVLLKGCGRGPAETFREEAPSTGKRPEAESQEVDRQREEVTVEKKLQRLTAVETESAPLITISVPEDVGWYISRIVLMGRVSDSCGPISSATEIERLTYEVVEIPSISGDIDFDSEDGLFLLILDAERLSGIKTLKVTAESSNRVTVSKDVLFVESRPKPSLSTLGCSTDKEEAEISDRIPAVRTAPSLEETETITVAKAEIPESGPIASAKFPHVSISSPKDLSCWESKVLVEGRVSNSETDTDSVSEIRSLSYSLSTKPPRSGEIGFDRESGMFSINLSVEEYSGMAKLEIKAENLDGGATSKNLHLLFSDERPFISITSPENRSFYRSGLTVIGRVSDSEENLESADQVRCLSYQTLDSAVSESIEFSSKNGIFSFDLDVTGFRGKQTLVISAEDTEGNTSLRTLTLLDGNAKPVVTITLPENQSEYGAGLFVSGSVTLSTAQDTLKEVIGSLSYRVTSAETFDIRASPMGGNIELDEDGSFRFLLSTRNLTGAQLVTVSAEAWNGNRADTSVTIVRGTSDIPSFIATPGNGTVVLEWDPVPLITDYSIYYSTEEVSTPERGGKRIDGVESPLVLQNLRNGTMYSFKLQARSSAEKEDLWSDTEKCIPLSPTTLAPTVTGEYGQIRLVWKDISATDEYVVLRSADGGKSYSDVSGIITETSYLDTAAKFGKLYYYKVRPGIPESIESDARPGKILAFPTARLLHINTLSQTQAQAVAVQNDYAYLACGRDGMKIVDIYNPKMPELVAWLETADARKLVVREDYVYLADGQRGLKIIDASDPRSPLEIGARKTVHAHDIVLKGDYAFIADGEGGLKVVDVSNPRYPGRIGTLKTASAMALAMKGNHVFLADGDAGIKVIDVSKPRHPVEIASLKTHFATGITVAGNYAYITERGKGLGVLDISDPTRPIRLWSYSSDDAKDCLVRGDYAFIADGKAGIKVVDISDPQRPLPFGSYDTEDAVGLSLRGQFIYVADSSQLLTLHAAIVGRSLQVAECGTDGKASRVYSSGNYAFVADHERGLKVIDISDPVAIDGESIVSSFDTEFAADVVVSGSYAYVADGRGGLKIIDISNVLDADKQSRPVLLGSFATEADARAVDIEGNIAVVVSEGAGFEIVDISEAQHPKLLSRGDAADAKDGCIIEIGSGRTYLCITEEERGLRIFDISDPGRPVQAVKLDTLHARRIVHYKAPQEREHLYILGPSGLSIVDVTEPTKPSVVGTFETLFAEDIFVSGSYAFLADGYRGLKVIDISNPALPTLVSTCETVYAVGVTLRQEGQEDYALIVDSAGLRVIRILIPEWLVHGM
jgi:hypothetical protein